MNRSVYFDRISSLLSTLIINIRSKASNNILDYNIHAEYFYADLLVLIYGWNLINANTIFQNAEAIDLIDEKKKLIVQVTSQSTKEKINKTLAKVNLKNYSGYNIKFVLITENAKNLKKLKYTKPNGISFDPLHDIIDNTDILSVVLSLKLEQQKAINGFLTKELITDISDNFESDIVKIIEILSNKDLVSIEQPNLNEYEIEEKIHYNELQNIASYINNQKIYYSIVEKIFSEYDKCAKNKSLAFKHFFNKKYMDLIKIEKDKETVFWGIIEEVKGYVRNFDSVSVSIEELDMYVSILTVYAFIWCHIFENPQGYNHVAT